VTHGKGAMGSNMDWRAGLLEDGATSPCFRALHSRRTTEPTRSSTGQPYKISRLMTAQERERTKTMRILLSRGIGGIDERTRGLSQRWFDMVDWRSAHVCSARLGISRSIEGYTRKLEGEVSRQHPARPWVEQQEQKPVAY
jgi:hypothetical protein